MTIDHDNITKVNVSLYFIADDGVTGRELWRVNGVGLTEIVLDSSGNEGIHFGDESPYSPSYLTNASGTLYFRGRLTPASPRPGIAEMVEVAIPGGGINAFNDSDPNFLTIVDGTAYFIADVAINANEPWRINSSGIAALVDDASRFREMPTAVNSGE